MENLLERVMNNWVVFGIIGSVVLIISIGKLIMYIAEKKKDKQG